MNKFAKLAILLSVGWFLVVLALFTTGNLRSYPHEYTDFWTYLLVGLALINLSIWGYRWFTSAAD
jgi:hypothetical protein